MESSGWHAIDGLRWSKTLGNEKNGLNCEWHLRLSFEPGVEELAGEKNTDFAPIAAPFSFQREVGAGVQAHKCGYGNGEKNFVLPSLGSKNLYLLFRNCRHYLLLETVVCQRDREKVKKRTSVR